MYRTSYVFLVAVVFTGCSMEWGNPKIKAKPLFRKIDENRPYIAVGVVGDTQSRKYQKWIIPKLVRSMNSDKPDFVIHLGDTEWAGSKRIYRSFKRKLRNLKSSYFMVLGNHELSLHSNGYLLWPPLKKTWFKFWKYPNSYYYFNRKGYTFIVLDTSLPASSWRQVKWLRKVLAQVNKPKRVFLFMHRPMPVPKQSAVYYSGYKWHNYTDMEPLPYMFKVNRHLWKVFYKNRHKIAALFHGHYHGFRRYGLYGVKAFCSGGGGGPLEKSTDFYHYLIVKIYKNHFRVNVKKL